ncbi:putative pollen-specific leucine-rich repeat extensin-like protein 3 [Iris pallida]|uniref:Pollen-specific leucine-rich repeat extensin-like protein 3 n=1 Tax=Iris pallida TaxID=29817 RepID=A0AAX6GW83_IRIPA|nr:putative pollen-specific leucine-rich repeat extensin-like protein 3 [Iris pallida]
MRTRAHARLSDSLDLGGAMRRSWSGGGGSASPPGLRGGQLRTRVAAVDLDVDVGGVRLRDDRRSSTHRFGRQAQPCADAVGDLRRLGVVACGSGGGGSPLTWWRRPEEWTQMVRA